MHQEHTAMKVCTDACLFGAWVANDPTIKNSDSIIDIGTGTGLLSLMLAQSTKAESKITAVEIEPLAAAEALKNFELSPWRDKLEIVESSIQNFQNSQVGADATNAIQFDTIISNPPFYEGDLQSPHKNINLASHSTALPWSELVSSICHLLKPVGSFHVLIPALRAYTMQKLAAQNGLQLIEEVVVFNAEKQKPFRVLQKYKKLTDTNVEVKRSNFIIKDKDQNYTPAFIDLLKPYYLHL